MTNFTGRADLHMHTNASDGLPSAREVLDYIAERGDLDVIAITDHDHIDASLWAYSQRHNYPFDIVPGMEVTSKDGHVLALWVTELISAEMSLAETVAAIHEQNGIAVLAHPYELIVAAHTFWRYFTQPEVLQQAQIDGIEIHNAGAVTPGANWLARRKFSAFDLPLLGNSDAHLLSSIGCGVTRFPGRTAADLRTALALRQTVVEGKSWSITDYLKLLITLPQRRQIDSLETSAPSTHPTHP